MKISNFTIEKLGSHTRFSADYIFSKPHALASKQEIQSFYKQAIIDAIKHPLIFLKNGFTSKQTIWFIIPTEYAREDQFIDAMFILGVVMAFRQGEDLTVDEPISKEIIKKLDDIETFFRFEHEKRNISIMAQSKQPPQKKLKGDAQFFTLGVDSFYTLLCETSRQKKKHPHLLFIDGFDIPLDRRAFLKSVHANIDTVAKKIGSRAIFIESNLRDLSDKIVNWPQFHVVALSAVGMLLPFKKIVINGESFDWPDWGLRFGVDTLFSTSSRTFQLIGHNMTRDEKIKRLKKSVNFDLFLKYVRVCWKNVNYSNIPYNCSRCQKCIRTYLTCIALDVTKTPTFKPLSFADIRATEIVGHVRHEWTKLYEMLLKQSHTDPKLLSAIEYLLRKPTRV